MLKFEQGKVIGHSFKGEIVWLHCPECLKVINDEIKIEIGGVAHCVRCASEYYEALTPERVT
jgi:hypothetical protein|tara:strand:- start:520 stop:705 length:186 start_codon:yes stop_codon:yes gene_type:complete